MSCERSTAVGEAAFGGQGRLLPLKYPEVRKRRIFKGKVFRVYIHVIKNAFDLLCTSGNYVAIYITSSRSWDGIYTYYYKWYAAFLYLLSRGRDMHADPCPATGPVG